MARTGSECDSDDNESCCCGSCHIQEGAFMLSVFEFALGLVAVAFSVSREGAAVAEPHHAPIIAAGSLLIAAALCGLYGLTTETASFILADYCLHMGAVAVSCIILILNISNTVFMLVNRAALHETAHHEYVMDQLPPKRILRAEAPVLVAGAASCCFLLWWMHIIKGAWQYQKSIQSAYGYSQQGEAQRAVVMTPVAPTARTRPHYGQTDLARGNRSPPPPYDFY